MKNLVLVFVFAFAFCTMTTASDIAISTQAGWFSQSAADREMQEIVDNVTAVSVELFSVNEQDALADWVEDHTGDGASDLLILCGQFPDTIYAPGNAQADDSLAELFLDDGNCIVNTGDYMFYVVNGAGTNGEGGIRAIMDIAGITMWDDDTAVVVTAEGRDYTPSVQDFATDRPFHLDELEGDWYAELILAQNDAGTRADPVIVTNSATGGRLGIFYQTAGQDNDPRGEVISEWINNWYLTKVASGTPFARRPDPKDGTMHEDIWITLSWTPGDFAVSHDVYFGENFDDVNDATNESDTFQGNQPSTFFIAGFPGFAYPDGLVPGTTYYWRIDEVNEAHPNSPWKSKVWSFSIPPRAAYNPDPPDGARFIDLDVILSWTAGFGAKLHTVYFGDNFDDVNNAAGGLPQGITTYTPATLELEKTYYWRVDEFDAVTTHKGDVWSFTTAKEGGGIKGEYFNNMDLAGVPVLTRIDPQINFYWNPGPNPPPGVNEDGFSVRWTGEVEAPFSEPVTFITGSDDGVRLYFDGELVIDDWTDHDRTENSSQPIELIAGQSYGIVMEGYENAAEAEWQLYWQSPSMPRQLVPQAAFSPPIKASSPKPSNGAVDVKQTQILSWSPGENAASHQVYFGTDEEAVKNANTGSPEYKGPRNLGSESYDPGKLEWNTAYYWRVDEIEDDGTIQTGNLWNFTTANFLIVDDFEDYDVGNNEIWWSWKDGLGYAAHDNEPAYAGNGTGSAVGDETSPSYMEENIVHGGRQAMPLFYDNNKQGFFKYSEAELTLVYPRDWTEKGVNRLTIWFRGDSANVVETLYVALNGSAVVTNDNPNAVLVTDWTEWNIDLQVFTDQGMGLTNVNTIALGLGNKMNPLAGGSGVMYFDDIQLHLPAEPAP